MPRHQSNASRPVGEFTAPLFAALAFRFLVLEYLNLEVFAGLSFDQGRHNGGSNQENPKPKRLLGFPSATLEFTGSSAEPRSVKTWKPRGFLGY